MWAKTDENIYRQLLETNVPFPIPTPKIPTDNLYKFLSVFGLTMVIVAIVVFACVSYLTVIRQSGLDRQSALEQLDIDHFSAQHERDNQFIDRRNTESDAALAALGANPTYTIAQKRVADLTVENKAYLQEMNTRSAEFQNKFTADHDALALALAGEQNIWGGYQMILKWNMVVIFLGIFASVVGFRLWYARTQRHLDTIIKNSAETQEHANRK